MYFSIISLLLFFLSLLFPVQTSSLGVYKFYNIYVHLTAKVSLKPLYFTQRPIVIVYNMLAQKTENKYCRYNLVDSMSDLQKKE